MNTVTQLLCSTGAFSRYPDYTGYQAILEYGPRLQVDGFELMFYPGWYSQIERVANDLQSSGLTFPAMHTEKNIGSALGDPDPIERAHGVDLLAENCRLGSLLGTQLLVLHLWNWPNLDDDLANNLLALSPCVDIAARYHQKLAIETIPGRRFDPLTNVHSALECDSRCSIALDTEFLANSHQLATVFDAPWLWEQSRVQHVHIKDSDGHPFIGGQRRYLHPGKGQIDFTRFFSQLQQQKFTGNISLEAPAIDAEGKIDLQQLQESLDFIRRFLW